MNETITHLPFSPAETTQLSAEREAALRPLFPYEADLEYAKESGLIDLFYYAPGEDGLVHTLAGDVQTGPGGAFIPGGFHHAPSADLMRPTDPATGEQAPAETRVDRTHLEEATARTRAKYRHFPFEPHSEQVIIGGLRKVTTGEPDPVTGQRKIVPAKNSMFPDEYDPLMVMQAVRTAYENRDPSTDVLSQDAQGNPSLIATGNAIMIDGKTLMPIRMSLDPPTGKVMSAMPLIKNKAMMGLTPETAEDALTYGFGQRRKKVV